MPTLLASLGSWFGGTVNTVITPFYVLFALHATYCFITRTNVNNHKRVTQSLANHRQRVLEWIERDSLKGLTTTKSTLDWLKCVNKAISEEAENHRRYEQRLIIFGCFPLNGWENYEISKGAVEKLKDVECLLSKAPTSDTVSKAPRAPPVVNLHSQSAYLTLGRQAIIVEALQFIQDDTVGVIGMCGPDKDEKTELLMKINNSFIGTNFFDFVIFVTASTECSVQHIQAQIISRLGIQKHDDVVTRETMISELLWRKNILVLVDDLHGELNLRAVGIPYPLGVVQVHAVRGRLKRKVVITSSSTSIHNLMNVDKQIEVPSVEEDQARQLFNQHFGVQEDLYSDPHIGALAKDLVREIKGLPLELEHYGKLMKGKRDARQWEVTIEAVRKINLRKDDPSSVVEKTVRNLEDHKEDLIAKRKDVYQNIQNAERDGKTPTNEVKRWLEKGDVVICDADAISANHQLKKDVTMAAAEKLLAVQECLGSLPSIIAVESKPRSVIEMRGPYMSAEKNHNLEEALNFIEDDPAGLIGIGGHLTPGIKAIVVKALQFIEADDTVGMIGIFGPDKDEKTQLLTQINNSFLGRSVFDFVIFLTAPSECSVQRIQASIMSRLGIQQHDDVATQATRIYGLLEKTQFLVLVDDLHEQLDLAAVGIPYPLGVVSVPGVGGKLKRKVVITSPSRSIFCLMGVKNQIEVPRLEEDEACQLFNQYFGPQEDLYSDPQIGALAKDLVREIKGLPSELISLGKLMNGQRTTRRWGVIIEAVRKANLRNDDASSVVEKIVRNLEDCKEDLIAKRKDVYQNIENAEREGKECLGSLPSDIAVESAPRPVIEMPGAYMSAEKNHNLEVALNFIKDYPTGIVGIWGPGGVGKTYILIRINNSPDEDLPFNIVVYVTASRGCSVKKIQADIVCRLKLRKDDNQESQRCIIFDFLKMRSFLILLDDLWDPIDLEAVGIPYPLGTVNQLRRKVVFTTRSTDVCDKMDVTKELKVAYMQEAEAFKLFREKVGHKTFSSSPRIETLAKELVKELNGLPLALITIGRAMSGKTCPDRWKYAIKCLQRSCYDKDDLLGMEKDVLSQLKFSYDNLRSETLRNCFCICALWPDCDAILKEELARCFIGLGLVEVDKDIQTSYEKAYTLVGDLEAACLIDSREKLYGSFTMHDVIRDMAHWIFSSENRWFVCAGVGGDKNISAPSKAELEYISLMRNGMKELPPVCSSTHPMKLRMLCLGENALDGSIIEIKKFTSLTYLDLSSNGLRGIAEELCSLPNLEHLDLSYNECIEEVPDCFRNLIKLKFLYLRETGIKRIPEGVISSLIALRVIDLRVINSGDFISSRLFEELVMLQHLKAVDINVLNFAQYKSLIREDVDLPIRYLNLQIERPRVLNICDILSHQFPRTTLYDLAMEYCLTKLIIVRHELAQLNCFATLNKLSLLTLYFFRKIKFMGTSPASLFPLLTCLEVTRCHKLNDLSWAMYLPCLEELVITECKRMRKAFRSHHRDNECSGQQSSETFPCLKSLCICECDLLVTIGDPDVTFPSLEKLEIVGCSKLKKLPFQMDSLPPKLRVLDMDVASWGRLELEEGMRSELEPMLEFDTFWSQHCDEDRRHIYECY